jgi:hypothetical protein
MEARGMQMEDVEIQIVEFYERMIEDIMERSDRVYAF